MTVSTTSARAAYSGDGTTTAFAVPFYFFAAADLAVYETADGVTTQKTLTTHYTVSGAGNEAGGTVTMVSAPSGTTTLTIIREPQQLQETDYQANDPFPAETHEAALDRQMMVSQHLQDQINRTLRLDVTSTGATFPPPVADNLIGWNGDGDALENKTIGATSTDLPAIGASSAGRKLSVNAAGDEYVLVGKGVIHAESFGFGIGGDDTTAFEEALAYMAANGGVLIVPKGSYTLDRDIDITGTGNGFTIQGAGTGLTSFKRGETGSAVFWNFEDVNDLVIRDLELDAQRHVVGDGNHGLRICRGQNVLVENVRVKNWTSSGIIYFDDASSTARYKNVRIRNCVLDAYEGGGALNGILMANTYDGRIEGCHVLDIGRTGSPNYALQLKNANTRGRIDNCYARNADAGIAVGSSDSGPPSNVYCGGYGNFVEDCTKGVRIALSDFVDMHCHAIDMSDDAAHENAVYIDGGDNNSVRVGSVYGFQGSMLVYIADGIANFCEISHFYNSTYTEDIVHFDTDSVRGKVRIVNYQGTRPTYTEDFVTYTAAAENMFHLGDGPQSRTGAINSGAFTIRNPRVSVLVLDTEASAASDDLDTITGHFAHGHLLTISQAANARDPTLKDGTGNLYLGADVTLGTVQETITLMWSSIVSGFVRANNGA